MPCASRSVRESAPLLALAALAAAGRALAAQEPTRAERIEALTARAAADDAAGWRHELFARAAQERLERLLELLAAGPREELAALFAPDAELVLRAAGPALDERHGALRVERGRPQAPRSFEDPQALFADLAPLLGPALRADLAIPEVHRRDGRDVTRVLVELAASEGARRVQQNERWEVEWLEAPEGPPRIAALRREVRERVAADAPAFVDCTAAVLGAQEAADPLLTRGGAWWARRVDALGEPNAFGHNGLAVGDVNGDGLEDLYVALGTGLPNRLYVQRPDGTARECAAQAGVAWHDDTKGALLIDLDGDGDLDLVAALGPALIVHANDGKGRFEPRTFLKADTGASFYSLAAADYDLDGDLDIYGCRYVKASYGESIPLPFHDARNGPPNHLLRNDGASFRDVTRFVGLGVHNDRFSTAAAWADVDLDGDPDLYVSNDFGRNNLYRNDGGRFVDVAAELGLDDPAAGMGVSFGDVDGDGRLDLYVSNMWSAPGLRAAGDPRFRPDDPAPLRAEVAGHAMGNRLFLARAQGPWRAAGEDLDVRRGGWSWGSLLADLDLDGRLDVLVPSGFVSGDEPGDLAGFFWREVAARTPAAAEPSEAYEDGWIAATRRMDLGQPWAGGERDRCYLQTSAGAFAEVAAAAGLDDPGDARALVLCDWDGDGDLDAWLASSTAPRLRFLRNDLPRAGRSVSLLLQGSACNRDAVGARVELTADGRTHVREVTAGDGYLSQSTRWLVIGVGGAERIERARVRWPGGAAEEVAGLAPGGRYRVVQGAGRGAPVPPRPAPELAPGGLELGGDDPPERAILRTPLPLAPTLLAALRAGSDGEGPLLAVLEGPAGASGDAPSLADLDVVEVPADAAGGALRSALEVVADSLLGPRATADRTVRLLVDGAGNVQAAYPGALRREHLAADLATLGLHPQRPSPRTARPGLWFFGMPRDLQGLARRLQRAGHEREAAWYRDLDAKR